MHAPQLAAILQSSYQHQLPGARPTEGLSWVKDGQAFAADAATSGGQQRD